MALINKPHNFVPNTTIVASEANDNFDKIYNEFNGNIGANNLADGSVTSGKLASKAVTSNKLANNISTDTIEATNKLKGKDVEVTNKLDASGASSVKVPFTTIVEQGGNATKGYIRYSNHIQIAWVHIRASVSSSSWASWGSMYRGTTGNLGSWAKPFSGHIGTWVTIGASVYWASHTDYSNTKIGEITFFRSTSPRPVNKVVNIWAQGEW